MEASLEQYARYGSQACTQNPDLVPPIDDLRNEDPRFTELMLAWLQYDNGRPLGSVPNISLTRVAID